MNHDATVNEKMKKETDVVDSQTQKTIQHTDTY